MSSINHNFTLEIEVLSPLHIGAGSEKDWVKGLDYITDQNSVIKLNTRKLYEHFAGKIEQLSTILTTRNETQLKTLIQGKLKELTEKRFPISVSSDNDIKTHIKTGNKPYIPGSSLKGALRSVLLNQFLPIQRPRTLNEREYFGTSTSGNEFMRFVKISDAHFEDTELVNTKIFNLFGTNPNFRGGWKHNRNAQNSTTADFRETGFNTIYEIIKPHQKSNMLSLQLSEKQILNLENNTNLHVNTQGKAILENENPLSELFKIINTYTKTYIEREIAFFSAYPNNETDNIIENLTTIKSSIPDDNSACVMRMSAGSGFHSVTGDWQFNVHSIDEIEVYNGRSRGKYQHQKSAKSRKIAVLGENFMPMGFVKLREITENEIKQKETEREQQLKIEREKAEQARKEKEALELKEKQYQEFLTSARNAFESKDYETALEKFQAAQQLNENADLNSEIQKCLGEIDKIKQAEKAEKERRQLFENVAKADNEKKEAEQNAAKSGLEQFVTFKKTDLKKFQNLESTVKRYLQLQSTLSNVDVNYFLKTCTEIYEKSPNFEKKQFEKKYIKIIETWLGTETAQTWFNEIEKK